MKKNVLKTFWWYLRVLRWLLVLEILIRIRQIKGM